MLSLLRWGLGSGNDPLTDKERIKAAEKQQHAATAGRAKMANPSQNKRKRTNTLVQSGTSTTGRVKQAKRSANSTVRASRDDTEPHTSHVPTHHESRQNFIDELMASVHGVSPPFRPPIIEAQPVAASTSAPQPAPILSEQVVEPVESVLEDILPASVPKPPDTSLVQQVIQEQFSLEILLKHRELRLIDQEIAKCQVALEQLRRCRAIPFPSQSSKSNDMLNVSGGIGQPLRTRLSRQPTQPTPWGIIEGPYSRHYSQWLIPDPEFDGGVVEDYQGLSYRGSSKGLLDRQTRGGKSDLKSRSHRGGFDSSRFQALPSGYPPAKEEKGIAILKRHSDGKMVKLYCGICNRDDFSSPQGFINHYRIAHDKNLKSHEQAAQVCGVELGANEVAPTSGAPATAGGIQTPAGSLVHALNKPLANIPSAPVVPTLSIPVPRKKRAAQAAAAGAAAKESAKAAPQFTPSTATPHLSQVLASAGHGGDFASLVTEMKEKLIEPPLPEEDSSESSEPEEVTTPVTTHMARIPSSSGAPTQRSSVRGGFVNLAGMRPQSRKGPGGEQQTPHVRPGRRAAGSRAEDGQGGGLATGLEMLVEQQQELSPHTVESNNAPSLTSDSEDDEYRNGSSTGPSSHGSDGEDEDHVDVDVEVQELGREREEHDHHRSDAIVDKNDPELHASRRAKVKAPRRGGAASAPVAVAPIREAVGKPDAPRKRGRPRKVQPK